MSFKKGALIFSDMAKSFPKKPKPSSKSKKATKIDSQFARKLPVSLLDSDLWGWMQGFLDKYGELPDELNHDEFRVHGVYSGNVTEPFANWNQWSILPIAGHSTGDVIGLKPLLSRPPSQWPVVDVSHNGDGGIVIASSIANLVPAFLTRHANVGCEEYSRTRETLLALTRDFGGDPKLTATLIEELSDGENIPTEFEGVLRYEKQSFLSDFYSTYKTVLTDKDADVVEAWRAYAQKHPHFEAGWWLLVKALINTTHERTLQMAWQAATLNHWFNGYYNFDAIKANADTAGIDSDLLREDYSDWLWEDEPVEFVAQLLREANPEPLRKEPLWPAVLAVADDKPSSELWLAGALALEKLGRFHDAYVAFQNASKFAAQEGEDSSKQAIEGGLRCVKALKNPWVTNLIQPLLESGDGESASDPEDEA